MRRPLSFLSLVTLLAPMAVLALEYRDTSSQYRDAPFTRAESAGISLLTNAGVLEGNPDGAFRAQRSLNRAEFAKIALALWRLHEDLPISDMMFRTNCFIDVRGGVWYADPVCRAKELGIVRGNVLPSVPSQEWPFEPERPVRVEEAVKMLAVVFEWEVDTLANLPADRWYEPYMSAAEVRRVVPYGTLTVGARLTRGQMARLAAAAYAESKGELHRYRDAEQGRTPSSGSSSVSSSSSVASAQGGATTSSSSVSSQGSSSVASGRGSAVQFPARSRFLVLGESRTQPIASLRIFADKEALLLRTVTVKLEDEIDSFDALFLIDEFGTEITQLSLDGFDSSHKTWKGSIAASAYRLPKGVERVFGITARMKERNAGGLAEELVEVDEIRFTAMGEDSSSDYNPTSSGILFPQHQTAQARITAVSNVLQADGDAIPLGNDQIVAAFAFSGSKVPGADLRVRSLQFQVSDSGNLTLAAWEIGSVEAPDRWPCTVSDRVVNCTNIPAELGTISSGPRTLRLFADVSLRPDTGKSFLQVSLNQPGNVVEAGGIHWSDGAGTYFWTELSSPIARSARFD